MHDTTLSAPSAPLTSVCSRCDEDGHIHNANNVYNQAYGIIPSFCDCQRGREQYREYVSTPRMQQHAHSQKLLRVRRALDRSGVGKSFFDKTLDTLKGNEKLHERLARFVECWPDIKEQGTGLYFWGDVGRGKTHAAAAVSNALISKHAVEVMFVNIADMSRRLKDMIGMDNEERKSAGDTKLVQEMQQAELLVMDDLGVEQSSAWIDETLYLVLNHRYEECKPTIVTSNRSLEDLHASYRPQIASRLSERCRVFQFAGENWRNKITPNF